jgi:hypothetical protein
MRRPACQSLMLQDAYPSQAEGGLEGGVCGALKRALKAWDQKRWDGKPEFKYGGANSLYRRAKATTRAEVTWNPTPTAASATPIKVPRAPKPMQGSRSEAKSLPHLSRTQNYRRNLTPEQQQTLLARRREIYRAKHGPPKRRPPLDLEKRRQSVKRACAAFRARQKAKTK